VFTHQSLSRPLAGFGLRAQVSAAYAWTSTTSGYPVVKNLPFGASLGQQQFRTDRFQLGHLVSYGYGEFLSPGIAYIGFVFRSNVSDGEQYGWVRVRMRGDKRKDTFEVIDFAYGDPGELVTVGQTSDEAPVSAMGSLGLLAAGAAGLVAWRKRRGKIQPNE
jgi:LPXTG-motif cell wall-anchored protein